MLLAFQPDIVFAASILMRFLNALHVCKSEGWGEADSSQ